MRFKIILSILILPAMLFAQPSWKRTAQKVERDLELFHIAQMANIPTTETIKKGGYMYEISHRFGSLNSGYDGFYGFDGPVTMRTSLSYGITKRLMATVGRSNVQDNLDFRLKHRTLQFKSEKFPTAVALSGGIAFNTEAYGAIERRASFDANSMQYFGQVIINSMLLNEKLGVGIVPSVVYNSFIFANDYEADTKYTTSVPVYAQLFLNRMWSVWFEYTPIVGGWKGNISFDASEANQSHNGLAIGIAIETGGHVFYLFGTNNERLNASQYLVGAGAKIDNSDAWRAGFGITREL